MGALAISVFISAIVNSYDRTPKDIPLGIDEVKLADRDSRDTATQIQTRSCVIEYVSNCSMKMNFLNLLKISLEEEAHMARRCVKNTVDLIACEGRLVSRYSFYDI